MAEDSRRRVRQQKPVISFKFEIGINLRQPVLSPDGKQLGKIFPHSFSRWALGTRVWHTWRTRRMGYWEPSNVDNSSQSDRPHCQCQCLASTARSHIYLLIALGSGTPAALHRQVNEFAPACWDTSFPPSTFGP